MLTLTRLGVVTLIVVFGAIPVAASAATVGQSFRSNLVAVNPMTNVPSGDLVSVQIQSNVGSRISVEGDTFAVLTVEDYYVRGRLVLPKGTPGYGVVTHIKRAGMFHSGGELTFTVKRLIAPDGSEVAVETNGATADADKKSEKNGNEVGQYLLFGLGGVFSHRGNDILIKKGTMFHVATLQTRDVPVVSYGIQPAMIDMNMVTPER